MAAIQKGSSVAAKQSKPSKEASPVDTYSASGTMVNEPSALQRQSLHARTFRSELQQIHDRVHAIEDSQNAMAREIGDLKTVMDECVAHMKTLVTKNAALENASTQLARQNDKFYEDNVIDPMVRHLFPMYDLIEYRSQQLARMDANEGVDEWSKVFAALMTMLEEFLGTYDIVPYRHVPGAEFNSKIMRPLRECATSEQSRHLTVHESCQCGFRKGNQVVRPEQVMLYTFNG